jgi:hypothetical protein
VPGLKFSMATSVVGAQAMDHRPAFRPLQIDRQAALVAVEGSEEAAAEAAQPSGMIAPRRGLHLHDIGAEPGFACASISRILSAVLIGPGAI